MAETMIGAVLPGDSTVSLAQFVIPTPGQGEVLIRTKASTICGSDIRAIYREHVGSGPEAYQGVIAGHEPCGQIAAIGPGCRRFVPGDRVIVYHISGCGMCSDCRRGYMVSCTSEMYRRAYGWQRHGGMAPYIVADEKDLVALPDELSYVDGAQVACGFGTVFEGLEKIGVSGKDAVLVVGLGPVGLAALMLSRAMGASLLIGSDTSPERMELAESLGLVDHAVKAGSSAANDVRSLTGGFGVERAVECSGSEPGRLTCIQATRKWGKIVLLGEGGEVSFHPSPDLLHEQKSIHGSWVTSIWLMEELTERLVRWGIHPEDLVTHRFPIEHAGDAYALAAEGRTGKIAIVFDE